MPAYVCVCSPMHKCELVYQPAGTREHLPSILIFQQRRTSLTFPTSRTTAGASCSAPRASAASSSGCLMSCDSSSAGALRGVAVAAGLDFLLLGAGRGLQPYSLHPLCLQGDAEGPFCALQVHLTAHQLQPPGARGPYRGKAQHQGWDPGESSGANHKTPSSRRSNHRLLLLIVLLLRQMTHPLTPGLQYILARS